MEQIKNMAELEKVCEELQAQGFWFHSAYELKGRKIRSIIHEVNTLHLDINERDYVEKFDGDFEKFQEIMVKEFGQYNKSDKIFELANKRGVCYKWKSKRDFSERTWHKKDNSITVRAYWDWYHFNNMFELMWYEGDKIDRRSEYNKIPYKMDDKYNKTLTPTGKITRSSYGKLRTVYWTTYANGNLKLTGDIDEFNELYQKVWDKDIEREAKNQNGIKYFIV